MSPVTEDILIRLLSGDWVEHDFSWFMPFRPNGEESQPVIKQLFPSIEGAHSYKKVYKDEIWGCYLRLIEP